MSRTFHLLAVASLALAACDTEDDVMARAQILVPEDVEFPWNEAYNQAEDGIAAILPLDVMVYDGASGEPVVFAPVELDAEGVGFVLIDDVASADESCLDCLWDPWLDQYVALRPGALTAPLGAVTDADGLARVYAVVDALPMDLYGFDDEVVRVRLADNEAVVHLVPR